MSTAASRAQGQKLTTGNAHFSEVTGGRPPGSPLEAFVGDLSSGTSLADVRPSKTQVSQKDVRLGPRWIATVVLGALMLVAGCGSSTLPSSWVAVDDDASMHIRWVLAGTDLSGQLQIAQLEGTHVASHAVGFTGSLANGDIILELDQGFGFRTSWSGTVSSDRLVLSIPGEHGTLLEVALIPGDVATFNDGVEYLYARAGVAEQELTAQEAREEEERQREAAQQEDKRQRQEEQRSQDQAIADINYYLDTARALLGQANDRLQASLEAEIVTLENEVAGASDDYDLEVSVPYALNVAVAYERDAIHVYLRQARSALGQARAVGPEADTFSADIQAIATEADAIEQRTEARWQHAVNIAASVGVPPDSP